MTIKTNNRVKHLAWGLFAALAVATVNAADVSGAWTWTTPGHNGGPGHTVTLTLKADGADLSGKISTPGRDGKVIETPIAEGKVEGDAVSFIVVRQNKNGPVTNNYAGTIAADAITGKISFTHDGEPQSRQWQAKRAATPN